ncbi:salivary acidic proline-rich phosphoprotein 1/2-like [Trichosurus vulpecula]|uniref:salivary acidic proline-rich phosphoprotein 1/2-like n=1 Tax=Trichosurus vulpecula TaxID=9337 RepID=UPI00186AE097|nr:salivary acidic proline-rich phosphoprotein 1/2-like [Trichosurus vulpecula]
MGKRQVENGSKRKDRRERGSKEELAEEGPRGGAPGGGSLRSNSSSERREGAQEERSRPAGRCPGRPPAPQSVPKCPPALPPPPPRPLALTLGAAAAPGLGGRGSRDSPRLRGGAQEQPIGLPGGRQRRQERPPLADDAAGSGPRGPGAGG